MMPNKPLLEVKLGLRHDGLIRALNEREHTSEAIEKMSAEEMFDEYCEWHGLIGWGPKLRDVWAAARMYKYQQEMEKRRPGACKHGSTSVICAQCDLDVVEANKVKR